MGMKIFKFEEGTLSLTIKEICVEEAESTQPPSLAIYFDQKNEGFQEVTEWLGLASGSLGGEEVRLNAIMDSNSSKTCITFRGDLSSALSFLKYHGIIDARHMSVICSDHTARQTIDRSTAWCLLNGRLEKKNNFVSKQLADSVNPGSFWSTKNSTSFLKTIKQLDISDLYTLQSFIQNQITMQESSQLANFPPKAS